MHGTAILAAYCGTASLFALDPAITSQAGYGIAAWFAMLAALLAICSIEKLEHPDLAAI